MGASFIPENVAEKRQRYAALHESLKASRISFESHWRDLSDFLMPRRTRWFAGDRNKGDRRNQHIIDSTGRFAARTLQSGLHAGLTSPARPWMRLTTPDPDLAESAPVKEWLHLATQRMLDVFVDSNLYNVLPMVYGDMGVFGSAAMAVVEDTDDIFRCYSYPIGSYWIGMDGRGIVSTFMREYELSVRQVVQQFALRPDNSIDWSILSPALKTCWDRGQYEDAVPVTWAVKPNDEPNPNRLEAQFLPFSSCHFESAGDQDKLLRESGFRRFPVMAPRWDVTGEDTYGTDCPGMTALGDVKQLQIMQRSKGRAIAKMIDPPLSGPSALRTQKTSLIPGDITYLDVREGQQGLKSIHDVNIDLGAFTADIAETQFRVRRAFFEDLFLMMAQSDQMRGAQPVTAREVDERHEEKLIALGPVLERTNDELLNPIVDRVFDMMFRAGMFPPPPDDLQGMRLKVEYISIMAQAQKLVGVVGQDRLIQSTLAMAEAFPEVLDKINVDQVADNYGEMLGTDPRLMRTNEEANQRRAARQKAQADAMEAENAAKYGTAAKAAGTTPLGQGNTLLDQLLVGTGQGATT